MVRLDFLIESQREYSTIRFSHGAISSNSVHLKHLEMPFLSSIPQPSITVTVDFGNTKLALAEHLLPSSSLGWINGDETKLKQIIYNLLTNAIKFTAPGKRIGISAVFEGEIFIVTVWDEGIGIPADALDKIFDPFEQIKGRQQTDQKETGLGLAISRRLVELHQGKLTVASKVARESRFTLSLPGRIIRKQDKPAKERGSLS